MGGDAFSHLFIQRARRLALVRDRAGSVTHRVALLSHVVLASQQEPRIADSTQAIGTTRDISHSQGRGSR